MLYQFNCHGWRVYVTIYCLVCGFGPGKVTQKLDWSICIPSMFLLYLEVKYLFESVMLSVGHLLSNLFYSLCFLSIVCVVQCFSHFRVVGI